MTPDEILTSEEDEQLREIISIKKHLFQFLNKKELLNFIIQKIDETGCIEFERDSDRKFLNFDNLSIQLQFDLSKEPSLLQNNTNREKVMSLRSEFAHEKIVKPFLAVMTEIFLFFISTEENPSTNAKPFITDNAVRILPDHLDEKEKEKLALQFNFMLGLTSAFVFPPNESISLDADPGFTMEIML